jgi:hypothetical protein
LAEKSDQMPTGSVGLLMPTGSVGLLMPTGSVGLLMPTGSGYVAASGILTR